MHDECVCGVTHKGNVFCILCDDCNEWYNVMERCVLYLSKEKSITNLKHWYCNKCLHKQNQTRKSGRARKHKVYG